MASTSGIAVADPGTEVCAQCGDRNVEVEENQLCSRCSSYSDMPLPEWAFDVQFQHVELQVRQLSPLSVWSCPAEYGSLLIEVGRPYAGLLHWLARKYPNTQWRVKPKEATDG